MTSFLFIEWNHVKGKEASRPAMGDYECGSSSHLYVILVGQRALLSETGVPALREGKG